MKSNELNFTVATVEDAEQISHLIIDSANEFVINEFSAKAKQTFLDSLTVAKITENLSSHYYYHLASSGGQLLGVIGIRDHTHLYHLFVDKMAHSQGIGRQLWQVASHYSMPHNPDDKFTVNSAVGAEPFYHKLGFVTMGSPVDHMGIVSIPMCWSHAN